MPSAFGYAISSILRRIMPVSAPRIATQHPPDRLCQALEQPVLLQGKKGVLATAGRKAAMRRKGRGNIPPIESNRQDKRRNEDTPKE